MRKGEFKDGTTFFGIKVEHFVSKGTMANAIASHCWTNNEVFDPRTSKTEVMHMVKLQLFHQGNEGLNKEHWDGADEGFVAPYNDAYDIACEWIDKNYPYLK